MMHAHRLDLILTDQGDDRTVTFDDVHYTLTRDTVVVHTASDQPHVFNRFDVVDTQAYRAAPAA